MWRRQCRQQNTPGWRQWVAEMLFIAAGAPTRGLGRSWGFDRSSGSAVPAPAATAGQGWVGSTETPPRRGQHRSQPAASTQPDHFPSRGCPSQPGSAVCRALCIARAWRMPERDKHGDVSIPHSPSRSWDRRRAPSLELLWPLPSWGRVS